MSRAFDKIKAGLEEVVESTEQASASMIAAAPDLYRALVVVDTFLDHLAASWEICGHTQAMIDDVKAALAKAVPLEVSPIAGMGRA